MSLSSMFKLQLLFNSPQLMLQNPYFDALNVALSCSTYGQGMGQWLSMVNPCHMVHV